MTTPSRTDDRITPLIIASAVLAFLISLGASAIKSTVSVFFVPIADSFGESRGSLAWATTVFAISIAVASPVVGALADRVGPILTLAGGTALAGAAMVLIGIVPSLPLFVLVYGVLAAFAFTAVGFVPLGVLVDRFFGPGRRGFAYALLTNGAAVGFMVLVPLWLWLEDRVDWETVVIGVGVVFLVVLTPAALALMRTQSRADKKVSRADVAAVTPQLGVAGRLRICASSTELRWLALAFGMCGLTMAFIDVHFVPLMHDHNLSDGVSSGSLQILGLLEVAGGLIAGRLCDRGWIKRTLIGGYVLRGVAMIFVVPNPSAPLVLIFGAVFGASYLITVIASTMWVMRVVPKEVRGTAVGILWTIHSLGQAVCSQVGGAIFDATDSYRAVVLFCTIGALAAAWMVATLPSPPDHAVDEAPPTVPVEKAPTATGSAEPAGSVSPVGPGSYPPAGEDDRA
jgi:predicted MFS family arabinose efflux permease